MRRELVVFTSLVFAGVCLGAGAVAQGQSAHARQTTTLADHLDQFGRKLFGGILPGTSPKPHAPPRTADRRRVPQQWTKGRVVPQSAVPRSADTATKGQPRSAAPQAIKGPTTDTPAKPTVKSTAPHLADDATADAETASVSAGTPRLHDRLKSFGQSAFPAVAAPGSEDPASSAVAVPPEKPDPVAAPQARQAPTPAEQTQPPAVARRPLLGRVLTRRAVPEYSPSVQEETISSATAPTVATPTVAEPLPDDQPEAGPTAPEAGPTAPEPASQAKSAAVQPEADGSSDGQAKTVQAEPVQANSIEAESDKSEPVGKQDEETAKAAPGPSSVASQGSDAPRANDGVLFTGQGPVLSVETLGPRRITVGKESTYEVTIRNSGRVGADQVVVMIQFPKWAELRGNEPSQGAVSSPPPGAEGAGLRWAIGRLEAGERERLALRIVPRESRPLDLAVNWGYTPTGSQTVIEVQEPKLDLRLEGPGEVLFGESQVFSLEVANSGTGPAENVEISLSPTGTQKNTPVAHKLGTVAAGEKKRIEVELTAREAGSLTIEVAARGDAGVEARLTRQVAVRRPALEVALEAPKLQFVGTEVAWQIRVSNPGSAPAKNVVVTAKMPPEVEYVASTAGGKTAGDGTVVTWALDRLDAAAQQTLGVTCKLARPGESRLKAAASAAGDLTASGEAAIRVEAIADLTLDVVDPSGPVAMDTEATYQVRVQNRGTEGAEEVEVVAYFSEGIEPTTVQGGSHETGPGQVLFDTIPSLGAGQDVTFQIKAKAAAPGNHVCRVEVYSKPLGTRLVSEETTYFYGSPSAADQAPNSQSAKREAAGSRQSPQTATRPQRPTVAPLRSK